MDVQATSNSLVIDGEMSALIRDLDWANTSLGPSPQWPQSLRTALSIILAANVPMALYWGPDHVLLYNDAWRAVIGDKHPRALGRPAGAMSPEIWETIEPMLPSVISGEGVGEASDQLLRVTRNGRVEEAWFTYTLSPIPVKDGTIGGILNVALETTARVTADRKMRANKDRQAFLMRLGDALRDLADPRAVMGLAAESLGRYLAADQVGYAEIEDQDEFFTINRDWSVPGTPTLAGRHRLDAVGPALIRQLRTGRTVTFEDAFSNSLTLAESDAAAYRCAKTRAAIIVPLIKNGRFAAALYVHAREPRQWTDEQEEVVRNVADLSWAAIERALAEDALRESEMRFRLIADAAPFPMWLTQLDGKRTFINQAFVKFIGKSYNEALDLDWHHILHPDDSTTIINEAICKEGSQQPRACEARYRNAVGEWRWLRIEFQARCDGSGVRVGFIGAAYDITTARQATLEVQALHESLEVRVEERTQERDRVWARSRDLLVVVGAGSIIRAVNPAWKTLLGHDPSEVIGQSLLDFVCPDDFELTNVGIDAAASKIDGTNFQNRCKHKDGTLRWVSWHTSAEGDLVYAYGRDVTAKEEQADALKQAEEALRQSQKMEAVGQLTGGVAHDFNNLLQGISGALEMLARRHVHSEAGHKLIDLANASVERGAHLTKHLLAFARKQQLVARSTDVNAAIGASGELLMRSLGGEVVIERQLRSDVWPAMADPNQLDVAILNLVLNARDAMPSGGTIIIGTENFGSSAPNPPADLAKGDYVRVWVTDVGTGMSEDIRTRIFEPFFTTKDVGKGTGLGLSQVHGFAHQSGGTVRVLSSPGRGTTVEIFLPRAIIRGEGEAVQVDPMAWRGTETVLVVDDDRDVRELAVACLGEFGYRVLEADSGPHGLEVLSHEGSVDLLLVDFLMPAMNGAELVRLARRMRPDLKVIFMTGYADLEAVTEHADPDDIIYKPFKLAALAEQIGGALAGRNRV